MALGGNKYGAGGTIMQSLGSVVGLVLALWVFDEILDAVWDDVNTTTFFGTAVAFVEDILPIIGILGAFGIIWNALKKLGIM